MSRGGLRRRTTLASAVLAVLVAGAFAALLFAIRDVRESERQTRSAQDIVVSVNSLERLLLDLESGQRGYVLTGEQRFLKPWNAARRAFPAKAARLLARVGGDPSAERAARAIVRGERSYIDDYSVPLVNAARRGAPAAQSVVVTAAGKRRVDAIRQAADRLLASEQRSADDSAADADSSAGRAYGAAAVGVAASVLLIALYAAYLSRAIVRPVRRAAAMAGRLAGGDLCARVPEEGAGEMRTLEHAFNEMAESIERGRDDLAALAAEQAALRRVATLVAQAALPDTLFTAVAEEAGRLLSAEVTILARYDDDAATVVAAWTGSQGATPVDVTIPLHARTLGQKVRDSGRPARVNDFGGATVPVLDVGVRSGVAAPITVEGRTWGFMTVASTGDEPPPPGTEDRLEHFTELVATAIANAEAQAALTASRARVVATADETRRRIERDLHDGAQQRLVSLTLQLRAAQATVPPELGELGTELDEVAAGLTGTLDDLREMARGIHPAILAEGGLGPALKTLARRSAVPVELDVRTDARLPEAVEVAAYYVVSEALANAAKHAQASAVAVTVAADERLLRLAVRDDGRGGATFREGSGLLGLRDRVDALGGRITLASPAGGGTQIDVALPL